MCLKVGKTREEKDWKSYVLVAGSTLLSEMVYHSHIHTVT